LKWNVQFNLSHNSWLPATDYPRASRSFPRIAGSVNEIAAVLTRSGILGPTRLLAAAEKKANPWVRGWFGKQECKQVEILSTHAL
jgi:hypothetical protein